MYILYIFTYTIELCFTLHDEYLAPLKLKTLVLKEINQN
jgi:hypothetical protein